MSAGPRIVMVGTSPASLGGIATVIGVYEANAIFTKLNIEYVISHCTGNKITKVQVLVKAVLRVASLLLQNKVQLVHIHTATGASFWRKSIFMVLSKVFGTPFILHIHSGAFPDFYISATRPVRAIIRALIDSATEVICVSNELRRAMQRYCGTRCGLMMYNPIEQKSQNKMSARRDKSILFMGRVTSEKGIIELLIATQIVSKSFEDVRLIICGAGDISTALKVAEALGIGSNVSFPGWVAGEEKEKLMSEATILALPSYSEGMPMCILEAMAAGTVVVATNVGGIPEAIDNRVTGILVSPRNSTELASALNELLADQSLRMKLSEAAKARATQKFSVSSSTSQLTTLYRTILQPSTDRKKNKDL